jgi:PKD repeat protein
MNHKFSGRWTLAAAVALVALSSSCTMKSQDVPPLTGPSELGTSITVSVSPDVLTQDGGSQSLVTVSAFDSNGKPLRNVSLRSQIVVGGVAVDFGTLSARSIVTGTDGRATLVYTAPGAPAGPAVDNGTTVEIAVTPIGTDFANSVARFATIRLVPSGVVVPPDGLQPAFTFTPTIPTDHQNVFFDASTSQAPANNPIAAYTWDFGDGHSGSGRTATHSFDSAGTFVVKLTISDSLNRSASTSQVVSIGGGVEPTAEFVASPATPRATETVNFNASASRPAPGRVIRSYEWDFGDGEQKTTATFSTTHDYARAGNYAVTLTITDDAGHTGVVTVGLTVATDNPTADFTFSPTTPAPNDTVFFSATGSSVLPGRTITSYFWVFGDGSNGSGVAPSHRYTRTGAFGVTLTVTDSAGKTSTVQKTLTVAAATP